MPLQPLAHAPPLHFPPIFSQVLAGLKGICEDEPNCKYDQGLCSVVDPDPYAWFRSLLIMDTVLIAVKELIKVAVLVPYVCRGRVPPVPLHFFCGTSPLNMLLALVYKPLRVMFTRRPSVCDLAGLLLADGLCEDVPQLVLQLLFVKAVSRTGLSVLQALSLFLTALGLSVMVLRSTFGLFWRWRNTRYQLPKEAAQEEAGRTASSSSSTAGCTSSVPPQTPSCAALPMSGLVLAKDPPVLIPGQVEARDEDAVRMSLQSVGSQHQQPTVCRTDSIFPQFDTEDTPSGGCDTVAPSQDLWSLADTPQIPIPGPMDGGGQAPVRMSLESITE